MGFMDLFSNMSEWNLQDLQQGGILGAAMKAKVRKETEGARTRPKPGKYCREVCTIDDDRCAPCLEIQQRLKKALDELQVLEESMELTGEQIQQKMAVQKRITNCTLCGAPIEQGYTACPYCETAYPEGCNAMDIPVSKGDRDTLMNEKIQEAWNALVDKLTLDGEYIKATAGDGWMGKIQQVVGSLSGAMQGMFKQNPAEIKKGAEHYQISVSRYIHGCATGEMKTPRTLVMEEQSRKMEEQRKQREAQQAAQWAQQAAAQPKVDPWVAYMQRRGDTTPKYSGGVPKSICCGNCTYYMMGENKCGYNEFRHPTGASDYCNNHRSM